MHDVWGQKIFIPLMVVIIGMTVRPSSIGCPPGMEEDAFPPCVFSFSGQGLRRIGRASSQ